MLYLKARPPRVRGRISARFCPFAEIYCTGGASESAAAGAPDIIVMDKNEVLRTCFGYDAFRTGQERLIDAILGGRDSLGIMPTGGGKSLCYQIPACMMDGTALVVSPLISFMKDQVEALIENGVSSAFINGTLNDAEYSETLSRARVGEYKLLYIAPERLMMQSTLGLFRGIPVSFIAVDKAYCISQWGQDFRPSYLHIAEFADALPHRRPSRRSPRPRLPK